MARLYDQGHLPIIPATDKTTRLIRKMTSRTYSSHIGDLRAVGCRVSGLLGNFVVVIILDVPFLAMKEKICSTMTGALSWKAGGIHIYVVACGMWHVGLETNR